METKRGKAPDERPDWIRELEAESSDHAVSRRQGQRPPLPRPADVESWWDDYAEIAQSQGRRQGALTEELSTFIQGTEALARAAEAVGLNASALVKFVHAARRAYYTPGGRLPAAGGRVQVLLDRLKYRLEHHPTLQTPPQQPTAGRGKRRRTRGPKPAPAPAVVLNGPGKPPVVRRRKKDPLSTAQYDVVSALLAAGDGGLTKDKLEENSRHADARGILRRLARDPDWGAVISFPGKTGRRYRVR
jgi:hypothetical protein